MPLQKYNQQLHKIQPTLTIITIVMLWCSPLFNTLYIWEILQSVKSLCKHPNNKGQVGSQLVMKICFHESQCRKLVFIFHTTHYSHHGHFSQFHIFWETTNKNSRWCVTKHHILIKGLVSKGGAMHVDAFDFIINLNMPC